MSNAKEVEESTRLFLETGGRIDSSLESYSQSVQPAPSFRCPDEEGASAPPSVRQASRPELISHESMPLGIGQELRSLSFDLPDFFRSENPQPSLGTDFFAHEPYIRPFRYDGVGYPNDYARYGSGDGGWGCSSAERSQPGQRKAESEDHREEVRVDPSRHAGKPYIQKKTRLRSPKPVDGPGHVSETNARESRKHPLRGRLEQHDTDLTRGKSRETGLAARRTRPLGIRAKNKGQTDPDPRGQSLTMEAQSAKGMATSIHDARETPKSDIPDTSADSHDGTFGNPEIESSISRCPSPWLERWYDQGSTMTFQQFGNQIANRSDPQTAQDSPSQGDAHFYICRSRSSDESVQSQVQGALDGRSSLNSSAGALGKRGSTCGNGRDDTESGDHDDGPSHPQRRRLAGPTEGGATPERYACPYQKRFPSQNHLCGLPHGKRTFYGWDTVSRVKQHILRSHGKTYHCSNCWKAFSAKPVGGRCGGRECSSRGQPDKHWLTDWQVVKLEAEKIPNSANGWYRLFAILFPEMPEEGEGGYRSNYTPYYCMWVEPAEDLTSTAPQDAEMDLRPPWTFPEISMLNIPYGGENTADASQSRLPLDDFCHQLETVDAVPTSLAPSADTFVAPADIHGRNYPRKNMANDPGPAAGDSSHATGNSTADETRPPITYATSNATNSTPSTDPVLSNNPYCACTSSGTCSHCRLKQRVTRLQAESESLRAMIEKARSVVSKHDGVLQDVHDTRRAPNSVMEELWRYQDELRQVLSSCRE